MSTNFPPTALIHDGASDEKVITDGVAAYYISQDGLSLDSTERAQQVLERLHALGDWAAGEIVERHRRDLERETNGYYELTPRLTGPQMLARRFVRKNPGTSLNNIGVGIGIPVATAKVIVDDLCDKGILVRGAESDDSYSLSAAEIEWMSTPIADT
ncbi:hypothetical protein GUK34_17385 [Rhizobium leguminosarum]|uniref:hypothetical protein n=1 Tax=Rhizobium ruizarguesonis TaxID=2081791 RepID=UPI0013B948A5|nr:hypothetical protein [Rhizobium ruizarguesonis]NEI06589.1 hypothetical protein [Rhizobium ruizarguesonis]